MADGAPHPQSIPESLVRFDPAVFIGLEPTQSAAYAAGAGKSPQRPTRDAKTADKQSSQLDDMLNSMLPPREWTEETGTWMQRVSKAPATRLDVISLQERLDKRLIERQARETGICPVREDLYAQAFDELIRQVTLDGPERGLLCMRVRDEINMTIDAYKTLYDSSVTFGVKKQLQAEHGTADTEAAAEQLAAGKAALELKVAELRNRLEAIEKRQAERRALDEKRRREELDFLKHTGQHLDSFLKQVGLPK
ncbi:unnamed protein product [Phaeothamnion confervicola]